MNLIYMTGDPPDTERCAHNMKIMFGAKPDNMHWVKCYGALCDECLENKNMYKACPVCGESLLTTSKRPYECTCGTIIWACLRSSRETTVTRYITSDLPLSAAEDII